MYVHVCVHVYIYVCTIFNYNFVNCRTNEITMLCDAHHQVVDIDGVH